MGRAVTAAVVLVVGVACLVAGFLLGWFLPPDRHHDPDQEDRGAQQQQPDTWTQEKTRENLLAGIEAENIEKNIRLISAGSRVAGTLNAKQHAKYIKEKLMDYGLDSAGIDTYYVLLSVPGNMSNPSRVELVDSEGEAIYTSPTYETVAGRRDRSMPPYNPYSPPGQVEGDLVYVNYGRWEDYDLLWHNYSITAHSKIVMVRYGVWISPPEVVKQAAVQGAAGVIFYTDPYRETAEGESVYPDSPWLPGSAVRRSSLIQQMGDPLTPGYPATAFARSVPMETAEKSVAPIPTHTVGYNTARKLFNSMSPYTPPIPDVFMWKDWKEDPKNQNLSDIAFNFRMRLGGSMKLGRRVKLVVNNQLKKKPIYNVCGVLNGASEPDRYVLVGGHHDAWASGAIDPAGGEAVFLEISRAFGMLKQQGWRPRRTILFCSWDAEEFGFLGSTEFVEDKFEILSHKAVAYINLDIVVMGTSTIEAMSTPSLHKLIFETLHSIPHPNFPSVYEAWQNFVENRTEAHPYPSIGRLQPLSDFVPLYFSAGVPSVNLYYAGIARDYPAYHTGCDTFDLVKFIDPTFQYHQVIAKVFAEMTRSLADSAVLPFDVINFADDIKNSLMLFQRSRAYLNQLKWFDGAEGGPLLEQLENSIDSFSYIAQTFHQELESFNKSDDPLLLRSYNDKMMMLERMFIDRNWKRKDPMFHHVLYSPVEQGCRWLYAGTGINDALCDPEVRPFIDNNTLPEKGRTILERQFAVLCTALDKASEMLMV